MVDARTLMLRTFQQYNTVAQPSGSATASLHPDPQNAAPPADAEPLKDGKPTSILQQARALYKQRLAGAMPVNLP